MKVTSRTGLDKYTHTMMRSSRDIPDNHVRDSHHLLCSGVFGKERVYSLGRGLSSVKQLKQNSMVNTK